uniref:putative UPF0481 protein At3g02645 n=1 Tax=Erigeron canadensis TaxID=72917 RepID=UPI001CB9CCF3|nr:putative UPF0481 protein At3g02645 [Erigeron canadensis]
MDTESLSSLIDSYSFSDHKVDEVKWLESMKIFFENNNHSNNNNQIQKPHISIFSVPKVLLATHPQSYIPQQVALGPLHHWRPEVYEMQTYKLERALKTQTLMNARFDRIVDTMKKNDEKRIRGCYHRFLNISDDALMWMLIVDVAFLLDFLRSYYNNTEQGISRRRVWLMEVSRKKLSHIVILRDLVMVENQIPLFLVKEMLDHQSDINDADETLKLMLTRVYNEISPFKLFGKFPNVEIEDCDHLLDYMYRMTVHDYIIKTEHDQEMMNHNDETGQTTSGVEYDSKTNGNVPPRGDLENAVDETVNCLSHFKSKRIRAVGKITGMFKKQVKNVAGSLGDDKKSRHEGPLVDEITIPSVTKMIQAGFTISPVDGSISAINFCDKTCTLYLPKIELDENTEVYLRNLVAYEACVASDYPLVLARYTELMNGIIDTKEDAKYLCENKIIVSRLKSDKEVADLWNGMNKSVKLTNVPKIDTVIRNVNDKYRKNFRVKIKNFLRKHVYKAWRCLTLMAALFMLILTLIQAFCSVYTCNRVVYQVSNTMPSPGG